MAATSAWQPHYADLCDDHAVRFGLECPICGARYATPGVAIEVARAAMQTLDNPFPPSIEDVKLAAFAEFDASARELLIECFRCQRQACPGCWDHDNRMCGECVLNRGLMRSPSRGFGGFAPLSDGRLERLSPGRFSDAEQPPWLKQLLATHAADAPRPSTASAREAARTPNSMVRLWMQGSVTTGELTLRPVPDAAHGPLDEDMLALAPTVRHVALIDPNVSGAPGGERARAAAMAAPERAAISSGGLRAFTAREGSATSNMVECPRCHTANYDFVTRCTNCQLQLIQICPVCEKLNGGNATTCEFCASPLERPRGWSEIYPAVSLGEPSAAELLAHFPSLEAAAASRPANGVKSRPTPVRPPLPGYPPVPANAPRSTFPPAPVNTPPSSGVPVFVTDAGFPPDLAVPPGEARAPAMGGTTARDVLARRLFAALERVVSAALLLGIVALVGALVAAEVSASVNGALHQLTGVDVRVMLGHFLAQMRVLLDHLRH
jgi:hypothetical protein